jgi:hypothetical protein
MMWAPMGLHQIGSLELYFGAKPFVRQLEMMAALDNRANSPARSRDVSNVTHSAILEMTASQNHRQNYRGYSAE